MAEKEKFRVSRATLYNTIVLLIDAGLVIKHQFGNTSQYERSYNNETHHHMICTSCGKVSEFEDENPSHYSLYIYGLCSKCMGLKRKKHK